MDYSPGFLEKQKKVLQQKQEELEDELRQIAKKDPNLEHDYDAQAPELGRDAEDNVQEEENYETRVSLENSLELHLRDIKEALKKIEGDSYGKCKSCGGQISEKRLEAFPSAKICKDCAG